MAGNERNTTTDTAVEAVRPDYFSFVCEVTHRLYDAMSLLQGAQSLMCAHSDWESSDELCGVLRLMRMLGDDLEGTIHSVDASSFAYVLKEKVSA